MRIVYLGTGDIGLPTLRMLLESASHTVAAIVTQPDKPVGRKQELLPSPVKVLALERGIPLLQPRRVRSPEALEEIRAFAPDLIVVMAYGQILPAALLQMPRFGCLNLHASLLPRHRGAAPVQAAILAGDRESGISVMQMDEGLDTGPVLVERRIPIRRRETAGSLHERLARLGPEALTEGLAFLARGGCPVAQDNSLATHAPKLNREHGLIDWKALPSEIDRHIRGLNPWPSAHTWLPAGKERKMLKVFSCIQVRRHSGVPGTVLRADRHGLLVAAGEGAVLLRDVQLEGRRRMPAGELLKGFSIAQGVDSVMTPPDRALARHVSRLLTCTRCPKMHRPPVSGGPVRSRVLLVGQAPGTKEPVLGRPFAWTAGKTLFGWFEKACGVGEIEFRRTVYMAAVCRCFPGKTSAGGDRVPDAQEIANCSDWLRAELHLLRPELIIPVGKLAIGQFLPFAKLDTIIGRSFRIDASGHETDLIPLPHPSGASPWHRIPPGKALLEQGLSLIAAHPAWQNRVQVGTAAGRAPKPDVSRQRILRRPFQNTE